MKKTTILSLLVTTSIYFGFEKYKLYKFQKQIQQAKYDRAYNICKNNGGRILVEDVIKQRKTKDFTLTSIDYIDICVHFQDNADQIIELRKTMYDIR